VIVQASSTEHVTCPDGSYHESSHHTPSLPALQAAGRSANKATCPPHQPFPRPAQASSSIPHHIPLDPSPQSITPPIAASHPHRIASSQPVYLRQPAHHPRPVQHTHAHAHRHCYRHRHTQPLPKHAQPRLASAASPPYLPSLPSLAAGRLSRWCWCVPSDLRPANANADTRGACSERAAVDVDVDVDVDAAAAVDVDVDATSFWGGRSIGPRRRRRHGVRGRSACRDRARRMRRGLDWTW
jgi:hypothetical protein